MDNDYLMFYVIDVSKIQREHFKSGVYYRFLGKGFITNLKSGISQWDNKRAEALMGTVKVVEKKEFNDCRKFSR